MNHTTYAVAPPDQEMVQVGRAFWQRAERRGLIQGSVRPVVLVEALVLAQDGHLSDRGTEPTVIRRASPQVTQVFGTHN